MRHTESGNVLSMNLLALLDLLAPPLCAGCGASAGESEPSANVLNDVRRSPAVPPPTTATTIVIDEITGWA